MKQTKKKYLNSPMAVLMLLAGSAFLLVYSTQNSKEKKYNTMVAKKGKVVNSIRLTGTLEPEKEVEIKSRLSGILETIYVKVGQKVTKGQPLARIQLIADPKSIEQATNSLHISEIQLKTELEIFNRSKKLFSNGVIPKSEHEEVERQYLLKKAEHESALHQLEIVRTGYKAGNKEISDMVLATFEGTVLGLPLKEGASVTERNNFSEGSIIAIMADLDHFNFNSQVSEREVVKLQQGKMFYLMLNAIKGTKLQAEWSLIHPKGETTDGVVKFPVQARILTPIQNNLLKPGFTAYATIELEKDSDIVVIEERNIHFRNDSAFVKVLNQKKEAVDKYVKTGISDGVNIVIEEGIEKGEHIVIKDF